MNTIGIIAEYNPFHKGHAYQIAKIKHLTGAQNIVVVMSGDFVQRGMPAWIDKYLRTQMALSQGVDFVFELPVVYATSSAESFALGGVSLLSSLGFVDGICFGSEYGDLALLQKIADFLCCPPADFDKLIKMYLTDGLSYPAAREKALTKLLEKEIENASSLLSSPNNILAIEYLKAIKQCNSSLIPYTIARKGNAYHDNHLSGVFPSASAIRNTFFKAFEKNNRSNTLFSAIHNNNQQDSQYLLALSSLKEALPDTVFQVLAKETDTLPVHSNDLSDLMYYRLMRISQNDLDILDMTPELYHRIANERNHFTDYLSFIDRIKTKQYTYSRVSRVLLHLLLDIYGKDLFFPVPYARLLGFNKEKSALLRNIENIPVITKPADGPDIIEAFIKNSSTDTPIGNVSSEQCKALYHKDITCADLYSHLQNNLRTDKNTRILELQQNPIIL